MVSTKFVIFDTTVLDLTDKLADPVEVLFGFQLGGFTNINRALAYSRGLVTRPQQPHLVMITDLDEGGNRDEMLSRADEAVQAGVNVIVLLALSDDGQPSFGTDAARRFASLGGPVFACTPDQCPDMMAVALQKGDVSAWAAGQGIASVREGCVMRWRTLDSTTPSRQPFSLPRPVSGLAIKIPRDAQGVWSCRLE